MGVLKVCKILGLHTLHYISRWVIKVYRSSVFKWSVKYGTLSSKIYTNNIKFIGKWYNLNQFNFFRFFLTNKIMACAYILLFTDIFMTYFLNFIYKHYLFNFIAYISLFKNKILSSEYIDVIFLT